MLHISELTHQQVQDAKGRSLTRYDLHAQVWLSQDRVALLVLVLLATAAITVACITDNTYDSGDSLMHYLFARWAWRHPENLLDTWGKPLFTLLTAGPARFGFRGVMLFQCGVVAWSAWLAYTIARRLRLPAPALAIIFCYAAPDYFRIQFSSLTEPLFGLFLVGAVSLMIHGRVRASAVVMGCLPLVRSEGIALWGLWLVYLAWERQWKAMPWLALGIGIYSLVGGLFLNYNFAWLFTNSPYAFHSQYGSGVWHHFIDHVPSLLSWTLTVFLLIGIGNTIWRMTKRAEWQHREFQVEVLILDGSIVLFVLVQSVLWAFGLFGSFGMLRVMTVIVPLCAVLCLRGLATLSSLATRPAARRWVLAGGTLAVVGLLFTRDFGFKLSDGRLIGANGNLHWHRDFKQIGDMVVADRAAAWLKQHDANWSWHPVAYQQLSFGTALDVDAFDQSVRIPLVRNNVSNLEGIPVGTYVYWDEFWADGVNGLLPLHVISKDPRFRKLWEGSAPHSDYDPNWQRRGIIFERIK
jgi:hypothetical protein